jgi:hypothetical protein
VAGDLMALIRPIDGERRDATIRAEDANLDTIREQVKTAITALNGIQTDNNVTSAEVVTYLKQMAQINERLIRFLFGRLS